MLCAGEEPRSGEAGGEGSLSEGESDRMGNGEGNMVQGGTLLFMTIALVDNENILLTLCRGTQNQAQTHRSCIVGMDR